MFFSKFTVIISAFAAEHDTLSVEVHGYVRFRVLNALISHFQMLGESLYPLVDQIEHDAAAKVTGMLLEMDQTEVLHLLESPDALKAKVAEAMEVLRNVTQQQQGGAPPTDQLQALSLNDSLAS